MFAHPQNSAHFPKLKQLGMAMAAVLAVIAQGTLTWGQDGYSRTVPDWSITQPVAPRRLPPVEAKQPGDGRFAGANARSSPSLSTTTTGSSPKSPAARWWMASQTEKQPAPQNEPPPEPPVPPADANPGGGAAEGDKSSLGESPKDESEVFLRQSTVLLKPGQGQYDIGFLYLWQESLFPTQLVSGDLAREQIRFRELLMPLNVRYGIREGTELFGSLPVGFSIFERSDVERDEITSRGGAGDLTAGIKSLRIKETESLPDVILLGSFSAPLGAEPYRLSDSATIGSGFWNISGGVNMVKSFDPVVVFGGVSYTHYFERGLQIGSVQPGEQFNYSFGMGMAVNDSVVLSSQFLGALQTYTYINDERLPNSLLEPMSMRFGLTHVLGRDRYLEPYVIFGLTSDASDAQIGFFFTKGFGCDPAAKKQDEQAGKRDEAR